MLDMSEALFAPKNLLEVCQGMQEAIASIPGDEQDAAGANARDVIGQNVSYCGANKLEVHTLLAYALPDGLTLESDIWPVVRFGEMRLCGYLAQIAYMRIGAIRTLSWMIIDPKIRQSERTAGTNSEDHDVASFGHMDDKFRRPLYLPVGMIESVLIAA
jgi:hypothetical protein